MCNSLGITLRQERVFFITAIIINMTFLCVQSVFRCRIIFYGKCSRIEEIGAVFKMTDAVKLRPLLNKFQKLYFGYLKSNLKLSELNLICFKQRSSLKLNY